MANFLTVLATVELENLGCSHFRGYDVEQVVWANSGRGCGSVIALLELELAFEALMVLGKALCLRR